MTLVFQGIDGTNLEFIGCTNAIFRGATVYKPIPSFTQGTIVKKDMLDADHWYEDVQIDAGYLSDPADLRAAPTVHLFDPEHPDKSGRPQWKAGEGGYSHASQVLKTNTPGMIRLVYAAKTMEATPAVGDRAVLRGIGGFSFIVSDCTDMTFSHLTLGNNGLYGIVEFRGVATRYLGCKITYGPPPPGATVPPVVATSADGLHSLYGNPGPDIENCVIEGTPDDCIAIHGGYGTIDQVLPGSVIRLGAANFRGARNFDIGDDMRIQGDRTGFYADARVTRVEKVTDGWQYTLDRPLDLQAGYRVANPARCGHGYKIIGNVIRRNRARGMLLKADDGLVENNMVEDSTIAGHRRVARIRRRGGGLRAQRPRFAATSFGTRGMRRTGRGTARRAGSPCRATAASAIRTSPSRTTSWTGSSERTSSSRDTEGIVVRRNRFLNTHTVDVQSGTHFGEILLRSLTFSTAVP